MSKERKITETTKTVVRNKQNSIRMYVDVRRVEVIQHSDPHNGRAYVNYDAREVEVQLQDDGKTLKIFLK